MIKSIISMACIAAMVALLSGCVSELTGTSYSREEARQMQEVRFGTIAEVRMVKLEGTRSDIGTLAGGALGGIAAGSSIGKGSGKAVAAIAGALAGGALGNMAEKKLTAKQGVELTVQLENGAYISVVQQLDPKAPFVMGDRVKVLTQGTASRVVKLLQ